MVELDPQTESKPRVPLVDVAEYVRTGQLQPNPALAKRPSLSSLVSRQSLPATLKTASSTTVCSAASRLLSPTKPTPTPLVESAIIHSRDISPGENVLKEAISWLKVAQILDPKWKPDDADNLVYCTGPPVGEQVRAYVGYGSEKVVSQSLAVGGTLLSAWRNWKSSSHGTRRGVGQM